MKHRRGKEFPPSVKQAALDRCQMLCESCSRIMLRAPGEYHFDHMRRAVEAEGGFGGNSLDNCAVLCPVCHWLKTRRDQREWTMVNRREKLRASRHAGDGSGPAGCGALPRKPGRTIPSRPFRKDVRRKLNGKVEKR